MAETVTETSVPSRAPLLRRMVVVLGVLFLVLVVCSPQDIQAPTVEPFITYQGFACVGEQGVVVADPNGPSPSVASLADPCTASINAAEATAGGVQVRLDTEYAAKFARITCTFVPTAPQQEAAECSGTIQTEFGYSYGGSSSPETHLLVEASLFAALELEGGDSLAGEASMSCDGGPAVLLPFDGTRVSLVLPNPPEPGGCSAGMMLTGTRAARDDSDDEQVYTLILRVRSERNQCDSDDDCEAILGGLLPLCGPIARCQDGMGFDPCETSEDCAGSYYCGPLSSSEGACFSGAEGDPCYLEAGDCNATLDCQPDGFGSGTGTCQAR